MALKKYILAKTTKIGGKFVMAGTEVEFEPTKKETKDLLKSGILAGEVVVPKVDESSKKELEVANAKIVELEKDLAEKTVELEVANAKIVELEKDLAEKADLAGSGL